MVFKFKIFEFKIIYSSLCQTATLYRSEKLSQFGEEVSNFDKLKKIEIAAHTQQTEIIQLFI